MRLGGWILVSFYLGCGHARPPLREPALPPPAVGLWELAPDGAERALVVHDGSLPSLVPALLSLAESVRHASEARRSAHWRRLRVALDRPPEDLGLDGRRGLAVFFTSAGVTGVVLPVGRRDRFRDALGGDRVEPHLDRFDGFWCEARHGRYLCAPSEGALRRFGRGDRRRWPQTPRAPIELAGADGLRAEIRAAAGLVSVRARAPATRRPSPSKTVDAGVADVHPSGFLISRGAPLGPCTGDIVAYALPGTPRGIAKLGGEDDRAGRTLLARCAALLPPFLPAALDPRPAPGGLLVGVGSPGPFVSAPPLSPLARELLAPRFTFATWGRGFPSPEPAGLEGVLATDPLLAAAERWLLLHLVEVGLGLEWTEGALGIRLDVRTTLSYPDAIAAAVDPVPPPEVLEALAREHAGTAFADDVAAGPGAAVLGAGIAFLLARGLDAAYEEPR